ncbi:MAG: DNA-binding domain-containing protein [Bdellovibrionales bacterium]|nr:DNA-binding domain-containing protein [Bdellovibrionales bacterium]
MQNIPLKQLQQIFKKGVESGSLSQDHVSLLKGSTAFSVEQRVRIYHDAYRIRLHGSLADDFPRSQALLGSEDFDHAVREFLKSSPSRSWSLGELSGGFPRILARKKYSAYRPVLKDLAKWEWIWNVLFLSEAQMGFDFANLSSLPEKALRTLRLQLNPTAVFFPSFWSLDKKVFRKFRVRQVYVVYRGSQGPKSMRLNSVSVSLLKFLVRPRTLDEVSTFLARKKVAPGAVKKLFALLSGTQLLAKANDRRSRK